MARGRRRTNAAGEARRAEKPTPAPPVAKASAPLPDEAELLAAVESLYQDQLRPYGRILKKRLAERSSDGALEGADNGPAGCDAGELRTLCEECEALRVQPEEGGEWSALLIDRVEDFIDIYNPVDNYPEVLWASAKEYFGGLGSGPSEALPGGRYTSAMALAARRLPFLRCYSLGQVCHIMQIAIAQRKLLGYFNGAIVPYECSTSMMKSRCAQEQRPLDTSTAASTSEGAPLVVATWDTAREKLQQILDSAAERGSDQVPLSNVKRLFRSLYDMELSETALGHSKLTELLQDPRFQDICSVQLKDRGYVVVPARLQRDQELDTQQSLVKAAGQQAAAQLRAEIAPVEESPCPKDTNPALDTPEPSGGVRSTEPERRERLKFCIDEPLCLEEAFGTVAMGQYPLMTPSPTYDHSSQAAALGRTSWEATCQALGLSWTKENSSNIEEERRRNVASTTSPRGRAKFCPQEPLCIEEEEVLSTPCRDPSLPFPIMTPSPQYRDCLNYQAARWSFADAVDKSGS